MPPEVKKDPLVLPKGFFLALSVIRIVTAEPEKTGDLLGYV
jgi:hypothetical protein